MRRAPWILSPFKVNVRTIPRARICQIANLTVALRGEYQSFHGRPTVLGVDIVEITPKRDVNGITAITAGGFVCNLIGKAVRAGYFDSRHCLARYEGLPNQLFCGRQLLRSPRYSDPGLPQVVVRHIKRSWASASNHVAQCRVQRLSHTTTSPRCQLCA